MEPMIWKATRSEIAQSHNNSSHDINSNYSFLYCDCSIRAEADEPERLWVEVNATLVTGNKNGSKANFVYPSQKKKAMSIDRFVA